MSSSLSHLLLKREEIKFIIYFSESLLVVENLTVPVGVGYHDLFHALLYTDAHHDHPVVEYFSLVEEDKEISKVTVVETGLEMPEDLVVDSISNIIYFTDSIKGI